MASLLKAILGGDRKPLISKSKYLAGHQCAKLLWHRYSARHLIPQMDAATQAIFDQGHEVGELAKRLFPGGFDIGELSGDFNRTLKLTKEALRLRRPLFEASFTHRGGYCRVDILDPVKGGAWDLIEVKSNTSTKDVHLVDLAFQAWVCAGVGLKIRRSILCHINPEFIREGPIDPKQFFTTVDVTDQVTERFKQVEKELDGMYRTLRSSTCPEIPIGPHCSDPYTCPLHDHCWAFLPEGNVMELYRGNQKGFDLLGQGIVRLRDIPDDFKLTEHQSLQRAVAQSGKPHIDHEAIRQFLTGLQYPLHFLDFETFGTAIPLFDGTRSYQQIPFQFSCNVVERAGGKVEHRRFLAEGSEDPRPAFVQALQKAIGFHRRLQRLVREGCSEGMCRRHAGHGEMV